MTTIVDPVFWYIVAKARFDTNDDLITLSNLRTSTLETSEPVLQMGFTEYQVENPRKVKIPKNGAEPYLDPSIRVLILPYLLEKFVKADATKQTHLTFTQIRISAVNGVKITNDHLDLVTVFAVAKGAKVLELETTAQIIDIHDQVMYKMLILIRFDIRRIVDEIDHLIAYTRDLALKSAG